MFDEQAFGRDELELLPDYGFIFTYQQLWK